MCKSPLIQELHIKQKAILSVQGDVLHAMKRKSAMSFKVTHSLK